ncbi:murein transglycosylase domain-containing protein [Marinomonas posidonica]|uniref:murein transglycosylase domain-containing protein n=1 Tax=Marinomonas posidonica TaxID=936476 RepID=UPI0037353E51
MYKNWGRRTAVSSCGVLLLSLSGCQSMLNFDSVDSVKELSKQVQDADSLEDVKAIAKQAKVTRDYIRADLKAIQALYKNLDQQVNKKWGKNNSQLPNKKKYVKYVNNYQARAIVDFDNGKVRVETVDGRNPRDTLTKAVTTTLLTTADPTKTDIFSSSAPNTDGVPFLYPQVMDNEGVLVKYRWRAGRYAQYLVANKLQRSTSSGNLVYSVEFDLVEKHEHLRQKKYSQYVLAAAKRYNLEPALIYGIIETESSFNPYAVSPANAYGLMQVVPATAGRDVYNLIKKKSGEPTKDVLFSPEQNIDIGSAYLHILQTRYLVKVSNKTSQEYSMISAYNGGTGNVLKTFDSNRSVAMDKINQNSSSSVYQKLRYNHPREESRNYLEKVTKAKKNYE